MATREKIAEMRKKFENEGYQSFGFQHGNVRLSSFVLPQKLCASLPNFAFQMVADDKTAEDVSLHSDEVCLFGVSESVPSAMRSFVVRHEAFEYLDGFSCLQAALREVECVEINCDQKDIAAYVLQRIELFKQLTQWAENRPDSYSAAKVSEFQDALHFYWLLSELLGKR